MDSRTATRYIERLKRDLKHGEVENMYDDFHDDIYDLIRYGYHKLVHELFTFAIDTGYMDQVRDFLKDAIGQDDLLMVQLVLNSKLNPNFYYPKDRYDQTTLSP